MSSNVESKSDDTSVQLVQPTGLFSQRACGRAIWRARTLKEAMEFLSSKMESLSDGRNSDVDILVTTLGKRLGRLEVSDGETSFQSAGLVDRCGVLEEALVEEHVAREADDKRIKHLEEVVAKLEKVVSKIEDEDYRDNNELKKRIAKLEEELREDKENFLELIEICLVTEEKVQELENDNVKLVGKIKDIQREKETLVRSLNNNSILMNRPPPNYNSSSKPMSNLSSPITPTTSTLIIPTATQSISTSAPLTQPLVGTDGRRILATTPPPLMFQPLNMIYNPVSEYNQYICSCPHYQYQHPEYTGNLIHLPSSEQ
eukprot:GFUD01023345.1.p1 GENE.GFUD01023345.1~~GFUD01023345.1.p1  ORF type:complete len:316 (+),score=95.59 GFUD01023345.1:122-1069(+)